MSGHADDYATEPPGDYCCSWFSLSNLALRASKRVGTLQMGAD